MRTWHIKSHNIMLSADGANTNSLQFNGIWIKFVEEGRIISAQTHQCRFIDTVTADGQQGRVRAGEIIRSDKKITETFGKLAVSNGYTNHENLMNLGRAQSLFPQAVSNFNNLLYNIRSYNKAHFGEQKNYYASRKQAGRKYLDGSFALGTTGPLLGPTFKVASGSIKIFSAAGLVADNVGIFTDVSFSNLYENLVKESAKYPGIIVDFDKEDDSLRDNLGHVVRAFSRNIVNKHTETIPDENIFQTMIHSVSGYLDGYMKRAKSLQ